MISTYVMAVHFKKGVSETLATPQSAPMITRQRPIKVGTIITKCHLSAITK